MISIQEQVNVVYGYLHGLWRYRWSAMFISWMIAIAGWIVCLLASGPVFRQGRSTYRYHIRYAAAAKGLMVETNPEEEINVMTRILLSRENLLSVIRETDMDLGADSPQAREVMINKLAGGI